MKKGLLWLGLVLAMILTIGACDIGPYTDKNKPLTILIYHNNGILIHIRIGV